MDETFERTASVWIASVSIFAALVGGPACTARAPEPSPAAERPRIELVLDEGLARAARGDETSGRLSHAGAATPVEIELRGPDGVDPAAVLDVDLEKKARVFGMRGFRIRSRDGGAALATAWVYAQLRQEGVLAPRTVWIDLAIDGVERGAALVEEIVEKELLEFEQRREGLTFGFRTDALPVVEIDVDDAKKVRKSEELSANLAVAEGLLRSFLDGAVGAAEVFDTETTARFLAVTELWGAHELVRGESLGFYFNPLTQRIEPLARAGAGGVVPDVGTASALDGPWAARLLADAGLRAAVAREAERIGREAARAKPSDAGVQALATAAGISDASPQLRERGERLERLAARLRDRAHAPGADSDAGAALRGDPNVAPRSRNPIPVASPAEVLERHPFLVRSDGEHAFRVQPGTWEVAEPLVLPRGFGLDAGAGTVLRFDADAFLLATGPLRFRGSAEEPVVLEGLVSEDGSAGWPGVAVLASSSPHTWEHVEIRDTTGIAHGEWKLPAGVTFRASDVRFDEVELRGNRTEDALNLIRSQFRFRNLAILDTTSDAFDCDHCEGSAEGGIVQNAGGDGIDVSGSNIRVTGVTLADVRDKALSVGEQSRLEARRVRIERVGTGIASKDGSQAVLADSYLADVEHVAVMAYQKKSAYGPARVEASGLTLERVGRPAVAQEGSTVVLEGVRQPEEAIDVDALYDQGYMKK